MSTIQLTGAIELPDGTWVRGRGLRRGAPEGDAPDHGLYLGTRMLRRRHGGHVTWPREWISWPDFLLPLDRRAAIARIRALHALAKDGRRVEVACGGGVGRTGTVVACLAQLAGVPAAESIAWTREHYQPRAVETPWQRTWVLRFLE
ncbi:protein-tyrosine phosphatase family protein [Amycolatopsis sp. 195334CR]|uniref:phosphatase domain-containing protein n=1 Tax=Amycolatopsis sp. 195334CR TaxID=2814588 RepID=UPI001A8EF87A|nr:protein-tyrosine phosphatase family protein [Amycolatopsis sp. 195334CR]MBN6039161.1 protein tyrosine phosphatase [Amycolatopsis sp. 195334CR]